MTMIPPEDPIDIPLIRSLGEWVWGHTPNESLSAEICLSNVPLMSGECWTQVIVKGMGIAMILGACFNKAPTLVNIFRSKSVLGIPKSSIYGETFIVTNATLYGYLQHFPFTAYGDNAAVTIQCIMVMFMMWQYSEPSTYESCYINSSPYDTTPSLSTRSVTTLPLSSDSFNKPQAGGRGASLREKRAVIFIAIIYISTVVWLLPSSCRSVLMSSTMPVMIYARGSQIMEAYKIQHTGPQSIATTAISFGGNLGRILTTIKEVGWDKAALSWYCGSAILNATMLIQYGMYWKNTNQFMENRLQLHRTKPWPKEA